MADKIRTLHLFDEIRIVVEFEGFNTVGLYAVFPQYPLHRHTGARQYSIAL
jgi:hypothetical protein